MQKHSELYQASFNLSHGVVAVYSPSSCALVWLGGIGADALQASRAAQGQSLIFLPTTKVLLGRGRNNSSYKECTRS